MRHTCCPMSFINFAQGVNPALQSALVHCSNRSDSCWISSQLGPAIRSNTYRDLQISAMALPKYIKQLPNPLSAFDSGTTCPCGQERPQEVDWFLRHLGTKFQYCPDRGLDAGVGNIDGLNSGQERYFDHMAIGRVAVLSPCQYNERAGRLRGG